jgi:hypothetical protein
MAIHYNTKTVTEGLVLALDAANIKSYSGSGATTWSDLSGNGNNGTLVGGVGYNAANGGSLVFNGSTQYVNAPLTKAATCTFSCWASSTNVSAYPMLFNAGPSGSGPDLFFVGGYIEWNVWVGGNNFALIPATANNGKFHHYVVINDATLGASLYYDGNLLGTATYRNASANTNLTIGGNTSSFMWTGNISNFTVHNKALSATEILQNYNALKGRYGL